MSHLLISQVRFHSLMFAGTANEEMDAMVYWQWSFGEIEALSWFLVEEILCHVCHMICAVVQLGRCALLCHFSRIPFMRLWSSFYSGLSLSSIFCDIMIMGGGKPSSVMPELGLWQLRLLFFLPRSDPTGDSRVIAGDETDGSVGSSSPHHSFKCSAVVQLPVIISCRFGVQSRLPVICHVYCVLYYVHRRESQSNLKTGVESVELSVCQCGSCGRGYSSVLLLMKPMGRSDPHRASPFF